jgi:hypothetical protein
MPNTQTPLQHAAIELLVKAMRTGGDLSFVRMKFYTTPKATWYRWVAQAREQYAAENGGSSIQKQRAKASRHRPSQIARDVREQMKALTIKQIFDSLDELDKQILSRAVAVSGHERKLRPALPKGKASLPLGSEALSAFQEFGASPGAVERPPVSALSADGTSSSGQDKVRSIT